MASHVLQCMAKACMCDTWQAMCVTHGMPCVTMHGLYEAYIYGSQIQFGGQGQQASVRGSSKEEEEGKRGREESRREREERKGKEKGRKMEEKERRKEKKKGEEEKKKKEGKEGVLRSEQTRTAKNPELCYKR